MNCGKTIKAVISPHLPVSADISFPHDRPAALPIVQRARKNSVTLTRSVRSHPIPAQMYVHVGRAKRRAWSKGWHWWERLLASTCVRSGRRAWDRRRLTRTVGGHECYGEFMRCHHRKRKRRRKRNNPVPGLKYALPARFFCSASREETRSDKLESLFYSQKNLSAVYINCLH